MSNPDQNNPYIKYEILPNLYLSRFPFSIPLDTTYVLNMCTTPHPPDATRTYLHIPLDDIDNITSHIPSILSFLDASLQQSNSKVLVHCALGINRSVAAVVAYVCHRKEINSGEALEFVRKRKGDVRPSKMFLGQIDRFFGREGEREDPMVGFRRRLEERKMRGSQGGKE
jgi:protein-tyrosine phosphatase